MYDCCRHVAPKHARREKVIPPPLFTRPRILRCILGADIPSCLRLDVSGLSKSSLKVPFCFGAASFRGCYHRRQL
ncbi:hypothetical protein ALC53_05209 [Atta colombica]|uniref:Uncharacterized protein n=1 Tax=Atta colombica TaxID=520822 RepID=A0A195BJ81_9HYME|nr:hypothetical protein ALC53_05209 [Atta colombica]